MKKIKDIKKILRKNKRFKQLSDYYHTTAMYERNTRKSKIRQQESQQHIRAVIKDVFDDKYIVRHGPFKKMRRTNKISHGAILAEILGSYEEPIQKWIMEVISREYETILDIGCADGYYAVGFAFKSPNTQVYAYDIDELSRKNTLENKNINSLNNVEVLAECTHEELNVKSKKNTLVFCDIEGFEDILLDMEKAPNLKYVDMLIESHDCFIPNMTERLISRFCKTHTINIIVDYPFRVKNYSTLDSYSQEKYDFIVNEGKAKNMKFLYLKSIK